MATTGWLPPPEPYKPNSGWGKPIGMSFASEAELSHAVLQRLEQHFHVDREVEGKHATGKPLRLDAVLRPRDASQWSRPDIAFGVEFKNVTSEDTCNYTRWAAQAIDYTYTEWDGYGRLAIFTCPGVLTAYRETFRTADGVFAEGLLGQFGVGELLLRCGPGLTLAQQKRVIWTELEGPKLGKTWALRVKTGSR